MTHYLIYKITNQNNGKIYIGQHQTENLDDGYMGSGQNIKRAINKYGVENFKREILYYCTDFETMNNMEEIIVNQEFVDRKDTYNLRLGGSHGSFSDETKRKMSEAVKRGMNNEEVRRKISEAVKKGMTEEVRRKMSEALKGHSVSEETRKKLSEAVKRTMNNEEVRKKISDAVKKGMTEEVRRKISEARKGRTSPIKGCHLSEETRRKMSEARKGKVVSEEHRRKLSASAKRRWAERKGRVD